MPEVLRQKVRGAARTWAPRIIAVGWATWCAATALAYVDGAPAQLGRVEDALRLPIWVLWAVAATLLAVGAAMPPGAGERAQDIAGWLRGAGLAVTAGLLGAWSIEFFTADSDRGWVSGKNYILLAACALFHGWWIGRNRGGGGHGLD